MEDPGSLSTVFVRFVVVLRRAFNHNATGAAAAEDESGITTSKDKTTEMSTKDSGLVSGDSHDVCLAKALYDFDGSAVGELDFVEGDIIKIEAKDEVSGWWKGSIDGKRGVFPGIDILYNCVTFVSYL